MQRVPACARMAAAASIPVAGAAQADVHHHDIGMQPLSGLDRVLGVVLDADDAEAEHPEDLLQCHGGEAFVFDDEDPQGRVGVGCGGRSY